MNMESPQSQDLQAGTRAANRVIHRVMRGLAFASYDHANWVLAIAGIFMILSIPWIRGLRIDAEFSRLIDHDDAGLAAFARGKAEFGETQPLFVCLTPKAGNPLDLEAFEAALRRQLDDHPDISLWSPWALTPEHVTWMAVHLHAAFLNQDPPVDRVFRERCEPGSMEREIRKSRRRILTLDDPQLRRLAAIDVLGLIELARPYLETRISPAARRMFERKKDTSDLGLIVLKPSGSAEDGRVCLDLMTRLEASCSRVLEELGLQDRVDIAFAGLHAMTAQSTQVLQRDMIRISLWAAGLLLALLWVTLRRFSFVVLCFVPLLVAMIVLLDLARAFFNPIHFITIGFVAIVWGLGLDVAVHLTGRLVVTLGDHPPRQAVAWAIQSCARPLAAGVLSTAAAFLALPFTGKEAMIQFGLLTAIGLAITLVVTAALFPALVRVLVVRRGSFRVPQLRVLPPRFFTFFSHHARWSFAAGVILVALCVPWALRFRFHMDLGNLFARDLPAVDATRRIESRTATALTSCFQIQLQAADMDAAFSELAILDQWCAAKVASGEWTLFESPSMYFPYANAVTDMEGEGRRAIDRKAFFALLEKYRIRRLDEHDLYLDVVDRIAELPRDPEALMQLHPESDTLIHRSDDAVRLQVTAWPSSSLTGGTTFSGAPADRADRELSRHPISDRARVFVTGTAHVLSSIQHMVKTLFFKVGWISLMLVLGVVWLCLRRIHPTLLSLVPVAAAFPVLLAGIVLGHVPITPTAIAFAAIILGIGIDDAVHLIAKMQPPENASISEALEEIGPVITLTTASTAIGFGCLMAASHPVVASLGQAIFIGVLACWVFTLLFMPLLLRVGPGRVKIGANLVALFVIGSLPASASDPHEEDLLARIQKKMEETKTASCEFVVHKSVAQLEGPVQWEGTFLFEKPRRFRLEIRGDDSMVVTCDGQQITVRDVAFEESETFSWDELSQHAGALGPFALILQLDPQQLRSEYSISVTQLEGDLQCLTLTPKGDGGNTAKLRITIDRRLRIRQLEWFFRNGDVSDARFSKWRRPRRIEPHLFGIPNDQQ